MTKRVPLPEPVARIYKATAALEALYPGRKFTPDGHLVGSIGEVIAASGKMWVGFGTNLAWAAVLVVATYYLVHLGSFGFASARLIAYFFHAVWTFGIVYGAVLRTPFSVQEMVDIRAARAAVESDPTNPSIE